MGTKKIGMTRMNISRMQRGNINVNVETVEIDKILLNKKVRI